MSNEKKFVKGKVKRHFHSKVTLTREVPEGHDLDFIRINQRLDAYGLSDECIDASAELICEAFNVATETGMTPLQLQSRIKELEDGITQIMNWYNDENDSNPHSTEQWQAAYNNLFSLIYKDGNPNTPFYCNAAANDVGGCKQQCNFCKDFK